MSHQQLNFFEPIEDQIKPPNGNSRLIEYGIQNEASDFRVHVGYLTQYLYVFPTEAARRYLTTNHGIEVRAASQNGIVTAKGFPVPISHIEGLVDILIPMDIYLKYPILEKGMLTDTKGKLATSITVDMLERNLIPLPIQVDLTEDKALQISGTDIIIHSKLRLQVKCDFKAGHRKYHGTGNVFLQVEECNPYKRY